MVRKACFALLPFELGLLTALLLGKASGAALLFIFAAAAVMFALLKGRRAYVVTVTLSLCAGVVYSLFYTANTYEKITAFDGECVSVEGYVYDKRDFGGSHCLVTVRGSISGSSDTLISFYVDRDTFERLDYGGEAVFTGTVAKLSDSLGFVRADSRKAGGVFLSGGDADEVKASGVNRRPLFRFAKRLRDSIYSRLTRYGGEGGRYLAAMLCGERGLVDETEQETFYRIGIGHIFAFSGTHVSLIVCFASLLLEKFSDSRKLHAAVGCAVAVFLVFFSGLAVSAVRAAVMMCALSLSKITERAPDPLTALGIAMFSISLFSPYCVGSYSFVLSAAGSFACTVYAGFFLEHIIRRFERHPEVYEKTLIVTFSASIVLFAVSAFMFGEVSIISPISNLLLIPICTYSMTGAVVGLILSAVSETVGGYVIWLCGLAMKGCALVSGAVSRIPFSNISLWHSEVRTAVIILVSIPIIAAVKVKKIHRLALCYCAAAAGIAVTSALSGIYYRDKIYLVAFCGKSEGAMVFDSKSTLLVLKNERDARTADSLLIARGAEPAVGVVSGNTEDIAAQSHIFLTTETKLYTDSAEYEALGSVSLTGEEIKYEYRELSIVISGKMVYNIDSGESYNISVFPVEIEYDRKTGEFTARELDPEFDYKSVNN